VGKRAARVDITDAGTPAKLRAVDPWYWAVNNAIMLTSGPFAHAGHEYLAEPLRDTHPNQVAMKGSQMGWTEKSVLKTLHGMIHRRYPQTEFTRCRGSFLGLDAVRRPRARFSAPEKF